MNRLRKLASVVLCAALIAGYAPAATQTALAADSSDAKTATGSTIGAGTGNAAEAETASATASSAVTNESVTAKTEPETQSQTASGSSIQTTVAAANTEAATSTQAATGTQAAAKPQAATEASSTAVKTKLKAAGRTASETEFRNNGYPYGMDMGSSSVTLVMELESGTIDTVEWSRSTDKNGEYQAVDSLVSGAQVSNTETKSLLVMDNTALGDEKYWYKCTVNGKESEAVQLVYASSYSNSGKNLQVLRYKDADYWYVCNGAMAYCVRSIDERSIDNIPSFNVIGRYVKDGTEYWINTSFNGYWEMYSSDKQTPESSDKSTLELDAFRVSFNKDDSHRVIFEADLADGQTGLSVGADVMLADSSITNYADNASLKGIFDSKTGDITSVQMVGAASIDDALPTDPAFVLHYMDTPSKYWIGIYWESDNAYWSNNLYDNSRYQNKIKDTKKIDGQKVVTEVAGEDSLMTTSWTGLASGSTVRFQFGVGSVEEAGATIKMQTTSTTIKLDDVDSSLEYAVYGPDNTPLQLVDENGNPLFESDGTTPLYWRQVGDGETSITFYGLTANTKYTVMSRKKNTTDTPDKAGDITTSVDPTKPKDDSKPVECTEGTTSLAFINLNGDYTYQLQDKDGSIVSGTSWNPWVEPSDGAYTFTNLHPGVDYYLTARTSSNTKSDKVKYTTLKTKLKYDANVEGSEIEVPASQDKSYDEAVTIPAMVPVREGYVFAGWSTSSDGSTTVYKSGSSFDEPSDYDQILYAIWKKPVRQIALIVSKPVINAAFDNTASYSAAEGIAGISAVEWTPAAQTAEYDVKYTATVMASIADGYMAAADLKATVNGKSAAVTVMNDSTVKVSYTFAAIRNMTDAEKISEAEQIIKDAFADAPAYNGTNRNDIQRIVDKALSDAGITDVTADVEDFSNDNATTDKNGNITANIKIKTPSQQSDSPVTKSVDRLPSTDDEKTEYAKKVIEEAIKNIPDVNNVTREDVQKTVDEALAKAGIPGVEAVVGSINVNPADESGAGSVAGVVNIKSGSSRADLNINKDITRLPSNDEEKVEYTKKVVQDALAGMTISDTTTKDDIQNVIDNALSKAGITDVDVNVGDLDVTSPTVDTAGRFTGSINITSGSASGEAAVNKSVAKKPATDEDRIELAKTVIEEALAGTDVNNGMSTSDIQNVVDKALAKAGLTDVSAVVDNVKKNNSTTDAAGSIIGNISISSGSKTGAAQVNRTIGTIPVTDDEKILAAKDIVQQILDDTKMYNSTSKEDIQQKIDEALAKAGLGDVTVNIDDINIKSATSDASGKATGTISISSGSRSSSAAINKTIAKTPSNDEEYAEAAKDAADNAVSDIVISNGNTGDDIKKAIEDELAKAGISGAQVITDDVVIKEATSKANGSVTGKVRVIVNGIEKEITINRIIPKLPMTDAEKISEAEQIIKDALADAPAYNGTNKNDLQKVVDKALSDAGITDVTADVEDFSTDNATTDKNGNITANIKIKTPSQQSDSPVTKSVDRLPSTDDEKTEYAKKVIEEAIKNIPDVNNVTREDVQKTVDEALAKAGIPGVEAVVGSINVNPADESGAGSVAGVVNIKSGSSRADLNINKDITRLPSNDEEKVEYTKKVVQDALAGMTISDTTTKDDIQNVIDNALSKAGITDVDVNVGDLDVTSPTVDTAGRFTGSINITSGSASGEAAVNKSVAKKPATDEDRIELAKTVIEEALAGTDVNNGMSTSDIQNVVDKALAKAGLTDVSAVVDNVKKNNSTTDAAGSIIGNISISSGSKTGAAQVNRTIGTIPVTDDEKILAAKDIVQQILDDTKMYNSTSKEDIQQKIDEALAKAGLGDVTVNIDDINIKSATSDASGKATGTISISSGSRSSSAAINKTIAKTPSNDEEYAEAAKDAADNAVSDIVISNGNTGDDIKKAIEDELAKAGISGAQVITDDVVIKEATSKANGSVTGKVRVIVNGIEKEITINRIIPKLPMTDQEKADDAGNVSEDVIKDITWDNETTPEEIKSVVEKAIGASEEFASEVTVTTDIDVTEATIHTEGKITGNVTIKVGSATYVIPIDEVIAKLKANVPDSGNVSVDSTQADAEAPKTELVSSADDVKKVLVLTRSELAKVNAGHNINIFLKVELKTANVTDEEKAVIEASKQDYTIGEYVDVSLIKDIDGSQVKVTELDGKIKISIIIPEKLRNTDANITRSYVLLRRHGSEQTAEIVDGIYDEASYTFTFETDRFSTYVIAYKDTVKTQSSDDDSDDDRTEQPTVTNPVIPGTGVNGSGTGAVTDNISGGSASDNGAQAEGTDGNAAGDSVSGAATGDSSPIIPLIAVMLLGGACIVFAASKKKLF